MTKSEYFTVDFSNATKAFVKNKKQIQSVLKGVLYSLELEKNELNNLFDYNASTDILLKSKNNLVYGVAMRVNFNEKWHNKITIRHTRASGSKTEFYKTIEAIESKAITASIGIQIDVNKHLDLVSGVVYDRHSLFCYIKSNLDFFKTNFMHTVPSDGNTMFYIGVDKLNDLKIKNKIILPKNDIIK